MVANLDGFARQNALIDPYSPLSPQQQALRIALYDEFRAHAVYRRVIEVHGEATPFSTIVQAEARHIDHLLTLFAIHNVPPVVDDWPARVQIAPTWVENCELGVASEVGNIVLYDRLLPYAQSADVCDAFFRLQAASYNHHLPAFRACMVRHGALAAAPRADATRDTPTNVRLPPWLKSFWRQWQTDALDPKHLPAQLQPILDSLGGAFLWGALTGAGLGMVLGSQLGQSDDATS